MSDTDEIVAAISHAGRLLAVSTSEESDAAFDRMLVESVAAKPKRVISRRAHDIVRCESPQRCCYLGDSDTPCQADATLTIVDGDPRDATYVCEAHRNAFAGEAFPIGSG